jgi:hypothetical protein
MRPRAFWGKQFNTNAKITKPHQYLEIIFHLAIFSAKLLKDHFGQLGAVREVLVVYLAFSKIQKELTEFMTFDNIEGLVLNIVSKLSAAAQLQIHT